jgi:hypothetical protein
MNLFLLSHRPCFDDRCGAFFDRPSCILQTNKSVKRAVKKMMKGIIKKELARLKKAFKVR